MCAIINKYDIHLDMTRSIEMLLDEKSITLLGKIPFEKLVVQAMAEGMSVSEYDPESEISMMIHRVDAFKFGGFLAGTDYPRQQPSAYS